VPHGRIEFGFNAPPKDSYINDGLSTFAILVRRQQPHFVRFDIHGNHIVTVIHARRLNLSIWTATLWRQELEQRFLHIGD
jgi:hypothetical protein